MSAFNARSAVVRPQWATVTGSDFRRAIDWARLQPPNPITLELKRHIMTRKKK